MFEYLASLFYYFVCSGSLTGKGSYVPLSLSAYGLAFCKPVSILCRIPCFLSFSDPLFSCTVVDESREAGGTVELTDALSSRFLLFLLIGRVWDRDDIGDIGDAGDVGDMGTGCASS